MALGRVLVVDDDESVRQGLVDCLTGSASVRVEVARDGAEALHRIARGSFDVVVLDVMMPHMSGIDFLDSLSAHRSDPSLKAIENPPAVIVVTATSKDHLPDGELEMRFPDLIYAVLRKPLNVSDLARRVEGLCG
jgi:CheY-like chemotaxis protein